jgi:hypothetical protein
MAIAGRNEGWVDQDEIGGEVMEADLVTMWICKRVMKKVSVDHMVKKEGAEMCVSHQEDRKGDKKDFISHVDRRRVS